jgi:hypothetical protein
VNLQPQSHNEGSGILGMEIICALLPLILFSGEPETTGPGDEVVHCLRSVL